MFLQHWSKLECQEPCPEGREGHAAVCLNYGGEHPQLLVTGGRPGFGKVFGDCWILDVDLRKWMKVCVLEVGRLWSNTFHLSFEWV